MAGLTFGRSPSGVLVPLYLSAAGKVVLGNANYSEVLTAGLTLYNNSSLAAGTNNLVAYTCPAGEKWRIHDISMSYTGTVSGVTIQWRVQDTGGTAFQGTKYSGLTSAAIYHERVDFVVIAGLKIQLYITGATLNDDGKMWILRSQIG